MISSLIYIAVIWGVMTLAKRIDTPPLDTTPTHAETVAPLDTTPTHAETVAPQPIVTSIEQERAIAETTYLTDAAIMLLNGYMNQAQVEACNAPFETPPMTFGMTVAEAWDVSESLIDDYYQVIVDMGFELLAWAEAGTEEDNYINTEHTNDIQV